MVVTNPSKLDPSLEPQPSLTQILKNLDDIEEHLKESTDEEALRSCKLIREALVKTTVRDDMVGTKEEISEDDMEAPSKVLEESGYDIYSALDDNDFMAMLVKHNGVNEDTVEDIEDKE